ncbi:MAG: indole-3-glycerol-phosphate synthase TrpC, partial [Ruminococcus sp.]|nr:indole-3-glycerol-phosphate synthase TrpC [Ruminococcus sp.]
PEDIKAVKQAGADGVLIGEALMRAADISQKLRELKGE